MADVRVLVCEGPDDLRALRFLFKAAGAAQTPTVPPRKDCRFERAGVAIEVHSAVGKANIAQRLLDLAAGSAATRPTRVAACFDADLDPEATERNFLKRTPAFATAVAPDWTRLTVATHDVPLLLAAWRAPADSTFDSATAAEHDLERVLIAGIAAACPADPRFLWATQATTDLLALHRSHDWKRAFRILNAAYSPRVADDSFVDQLLQRKDTKAACLAALQATAVGALVMELLQP